MMKCYKMAIITLFDSKDKEHVDRPINSIFLRHLGATHHESILSYSRPPRLISTGDIRP